MDWGKRPSCVIFNRAVREAVTAFNARITCDNYLWLYVSSVWAAGPLQSGSVSLQAEEAESIPGLWSPGCAGVLLWPTCHCRWATPTQMPCSGPSFITKSVIISWGGATTRTFGTVVCAQRYRIWLKMCFLGSLISLLQLWPQCFLPHYYCPFYTLVRNLCCVIWIWQPYKLQGPAGGELRYGAWTEQCSEWDKTTLLNQFTLFFSPTGALKSYLRELPEPLMTTDLYDEWIQASKWVAMEPFLWPWWSLHSLGWNCQITKQWYSLGGETTVNMNGFWFPQHPRYGQETTGINGGVWKTPHGQLKQFQVSLLPWLHDLLSYHQHMQRTWTQSRYCYLTKKTSCQRELGTEVGMCTATQLIEWPCTVQYLLPATNEWSWQSVAQ